MDGPIGRFAGNDVENCFRLTWTQYPTSTNYADVPLHVLLTLININWFR